MHPDHCIALIVVQFYTTVYGRGGGKQIKHGQIHTVLKISGQRPSLFLVWYEQPVVLRHD